MKGRPHFILYFAVIILAVTGCKENTEETSTTTSSENASEEQPTEQTEQGSGDQNAKPRITNQPRKLDPAIEKIATEFEEAMRIVGQEVTKALATCQKEGLPHLSGGASTSATATKVGEGCKDLLGLLPKYSEALWGRSYTVDGLLSGLARFEDELRIFQVTLESNAEPSVVENMSSHVADAAKAVEGHAQQVLGMNNKRPPLDAISASTIKPARIKKEAIRYAKNDSNDIGKLLERFDLYAYQQGANAKLVRGASLQHYGVSNQRRLAHRKKWFELTTGKPPGDSEKIKSLTFTYIEVADAFLSGYLASVKAFKEGAIADQAAADANRAELSKLNDAWLAAQKKLIADLEAL